MQEPGTTVIGHEPNGDVVSRSPSRNHVSPNRICVIVGAAACGSDDAEIML